MRARRPELFSDSIPLEEEFLDRGQFEYHLSSLTQRQEEFQFEHFCRRLAEKELCPNLVPQTGPMGGGDAKVDTETHPVSAKIAARWYEGDPKAAAERWGFAISAKEKWQPKIRSDVEKIVATDRNYSLIYFMTNQAVASRKRAAMEDELQKQWGVTVRILDKSWIVEKVVQNNRWEIVFATLDVDRPRIKERTHPGPNDSERLLALKELDTLIEDPNRYRFSEYQLIEDCLETALIARGLNRSRQEIDGRFARAERIAREHGVKRQLFRIIYQKAWTAYWWFDDFQELDRLYDEAEDLMISSEWTWDLEKLVNLWTAGRTWLFMQGRSIDSGKWGTRTNALRNVLMTHAMDLTRRTNSLWARTQLVLMDLNDSVTNRDSLPTIFKLLTGILKESDGLLDYPVDALTQIIQELGFTIGDCDNYDELLETAINIQSKRTSKAVQGKMRLDYGFQKLKRGRPYEAIEQYGKAQSLLAQQEHLKEFVESLLGIAASYEAVGLLWAARANLVQAFERTTNEYLKDGVIGHAAYSIIRRLIWTEIQLGRIPYVLVWMQWLGIISNTVELDEQDRKSLENEFVQMDAVLGILTLKTEFDSWQHLSHVAGLFDKFHLYMPRAATLFAMGYEDLFKEEYNLPNENIDRFFGLWLVQPATKDLPAHPEWILQDDIKMHTSILGCKVVVTAQKSFTSIVLGEALLAFCESFMASTIKMDRVFASRSTFIIEIEESTQLNQVFEYRVGENEFGESKITISHSNDSPNTIVASEAYQKHLYRLLASLIGELQICLDDDKLEALFGSERAQDRAIWSASMPIALCNVMMDKTLYSIEGWLELSPEERLVPIRKMPWTPTDLAPAPQSEVEHEPIKFAAGPPPPNVFDKDKTKHKDIEITSVINVALWDKAKWGATGFMYWPPDITPGLMIGYKEIEYGEKIFRGWNRFISDGNLDDLIDVTIIKGINKKYPAHYRIAIGPTLERLAYSKGNSRQIYLINRLNTMEPPDTTNLDTFLKAYEKAGKCYLLPQSFGQGMPCSPELIMTKTNLRLINAWEIGLESPIITALLPDDDPVIPDDVVSPPCLKVLEYFKEIWGKSNY
jgi:tetratricopeptide (TPR) repeat protein